MRALTQQRQPTKPGTLAIPSTFHLTLQRKCMCGQHTSGGGECEECKKKRMSLQRYPAGSAEPATVPPIVYDVLRSPGQPLDVATRAFFEPRFGHDLSKVRVHTDARAAESARAVDALAYTVGRDIVFGTGQYAPAAPAGRRLLAHELAHVVQQGSSIGGRLLQLGSSTDNSEREAQLAASVAMPSNIVSSPGAAGPVLRRQPPAPAAPAPALPVATFARFVTAGPVRCCSAAMACPPHLGCAVAGDPFAVNGMNLFFTIAGHRPTVEYGFVQVISSMACDRRNPAGGAAWVVTDQDAPGTDDSPFPGATCTRPNAANEIGMEDDPGFGNGPGLGGGGSPGWDERSFRMNATDWVIARELPGRWRRISDLFAWHSISRIRRNAAGNWELFPGGNAIGRGYTRIGGCPPP